MWFGIGEEGFHREVRNTFALDEDMLSANKMQIR
jgi:hypothetical protein